VAEAPIAAEARFAEPIARTDDVLDVAEDLLRQVAMQMEQRRLGGRRFAVTLHRSDGARRVLAVETGQPTRDPPLVVRLLRERIESLADPIDPGFGFDAITLAVTRAEPLGARQSRLDRAEDAQDTVQALIDRLGVRLGQDAVLRLAPPTATFPSAPRLGCLQWNGTVPFHFPHLLCPVRCCCSIRRRGSRSSPGCPMARRCACAGAARCTRWSTPKGRSGSHPNGGASARAQGHGRATHHARLLSDRG
jgi:protein ImuB